MGRSSIAVATIILAGGALAQQVTTVTGTGNPTIDVPAVQAAADQGGHVILKGHFSFDAPPTVPEKFGGLIGTFPPLGMVLVSKAVIISGAQDDQGQMATIEGGTNPFYVEAPGAHVTIQGLRFVRPKTQVINVVAVRGL